MQHFTLYFQSDAVVEALKKAAECCIIIGFDPQTHQFVFNAFALGQQ